MKLHLSPYSGISGDMFLGLLIDLGLDLEALNELISALKLQNKISVSFEKVKYHGIVASKIKIRCSEEKAHRHLPEIQNMILNSTLSQKVQKNALACFEELAKAEAKVHDTSIDKVHFHEVGALDAIIDICGVCFGLEQLNIKKISSQPVSLGTGFVKCAHGNIPIPVPAVCEILKGVPLQQTEIPFELTTPTGATLLKTLCHSFSSFHNDIITKVGYGAGTRQLKQQPNLLRGYLIEEKELQKSEPEPKPEPNQSSALKTTSLEVFNQDQILLLETNLDDHTPEMLGYVIERLLTEGALDVYATPIYMKKNRPGVKLSCLVKESQDTFFEKIIFEETTTFGVRKQILNRSIFERRQETVETEFGKARVKIGSNAQKVLTISPEYEDCKKLAHNTQRSLREIIVAVMKAYDKKSIEENK